MMDRTSKTSAHTLCLKKEAYWSLAEAPEVTAAVAEHAVSGTQTLSVWMCVHAGKPVSNIKQMYPHIPPEGPNRTWNQVFEYIKASSLSLWYWTQQSNKDPKYRIEIKVPTVVIVLL